MASVCFLEQCHRLCKKVAVEAWSRLPSQSTTSASLQIIGVDKEVIAGEDVELVCQLSGAEVVIQVDWMRTTPKTVQKKIFTIIRNRNTTPEEVNDLKTRLKFIGNIQEGVANILLKNASIKDCGNYSCSFTLFEGSPVKKSIQLTVHAPPVVNVLTVTPLVGISEVTLATCSADNAYPPAEVSWNASSLGSTVSITSISTVNPDGTSNVTCNLLGLPSRGIQRKEVLCLVRHPTLNGQQMFNYSINIHYPPDPAKVTTLQSPPPSVVFQCQTDANPEDVQYKWRRNGVPLSDNRITKNGSQLHFHKLTYDMNGLYDCEVSNLYGSATGSLHVFVPFLHQCTRDYCLIWSIFTIFLTLGCILCVRFVLKHSFATTCFDNMSRLGRQRMETPPNREPISGGQLSGRSQSQEDAREGSSELSMMREEAESQQI
ncbi:nectin-3-like protein isoform X1 [Alosa sapidissima]|uniref:nectin-3-like protein isoform X1 n=1 Tax=Alosa sapidissima TaxID=34773 RepID=UPI001C0A5431|nr:nectin-3-like protein isoform X1 [Alosa sapidissima]